MFAGKYLHYGRGVLGLACLSCLVSLAAADADYVIHVSIDGLGSSYLQALDNANQVPNIRRLMTQGASTLNARTDYDVTVTLPSHVTMITGRGVQGVTGHNWTSNSDPAPGQTIHSNKGSYVSSVLDVAHDNSLQTGLYAGKSKFSLFDSSYDATNGAPDATPPDDGQDKLDTYEWTYGDSAPLVASLLGTMSTNPHDYSFVHFAEPDAAGHTYGWGSAGYNNAVIAIDGYLGDILGLVESDPMLQGRTAIILTADHGGSGTGHSNATDPLVYTLPFMAWGPGVTPGADLYALNSGTRLDPLTGRPDYMAPIQPIRNGDGANLALEILGLNAIPGSTINNMQDLVVPEPVSLSLLCLGTVALLRRRTAKRT